MMRAMSRVDVDIEKAIRCARTVSATARATVGLAKARAAVQKDWSEEMHPRAENGRFGSGGGGAESAPAKPAAEPKLTPQRTWVDKVPEGVLRPGDSETWQAHFDKNPDEGGKPTQERFEQVHKPIMRAALDHVRSVGEGEKKIAIMSMGGPGSGKSSILKAAGIDERAFVVADPDGCKSGLPEYQKALDPAATYKGAAFMAHEESSYLAKQIRDEAIRTNKNLIIDGTGANADKFGRVIDHLKANGYEVRVVMPHIEVDEAAKRVQLRAERSGRLVPSPIVKEAYSKIPHNFERIAAKADTAHLFDNRGAAPKLVFSSAGGQTTEHDPEFMTYFRGRYGVPRSD